jgi:OmpA-OmpF porin, OOP family
MTGSLMEKEGLRLTITRQNDTTKSRAAQIAFATALAGGNPNPAEGVHFVSIMGDGAAAYLADANKALSKLGPEYRAVVIGTIGYSGNASSGEDAFMVPQDWADDPEKAKGGTIAGVLKDGDWNIAMLWAQQNGIKNNPDPTVYDPEALNWWATDDYVKAAQFYIDGACEDRRTVIAGKITSTKKHVCVDAVVTWTPGDVNIAKGRGGLVKVLSTKENLYQMPAVIIGINKWVEDHQKETKGFLRASFAGSDQVRSSDKALQFAARVASEVYDEETPAYWARYYNGVVEKDKTGKRIPLGGSRVAGLADNIAAFGLAEDTGGLTGSLFNASYTGFGNIVKQQYPQDVPEFPSVDQAVNLSALQALAEEGHVTTSALTSALPSFSDTPSTLKVSEVVAKRDYSIQFDTGKATIKSESLATLDAIYSAIAVGTFSIDITGHTDNTGSPAANDILSEQRAHTVAEYFRQKSPALFTPGRFHIEGKGQQEPLADNLSPEGRAKNRRVTITIGNK